MYNNNNNNNKIIALDIVQSTVSSSIITLPCENYPSLRGTGRHATNCTGVAVLCNSRLHGERYPPLLSHSLPFFFFVFFCRNAGAHFP